MSDLETAARLVVDCNLNGDDRNDSERVQTPQRIVLSRSRGFRLQEFSLALNGLTAVKVDRTTRWGNPFKVGERNPFGTITKDRRHSWQIFFSFAPQNEELVRQARAELRGKNLACWCHRTNPYDDECHAAVLLKIANSDGDPCEAVLGR